jgi:hypothetical protein
VARHDPRVVLDTRRRRLVVLELHDDAGPPALPVLDLTADPPAWGRLPVTDPGLLPGWRWDAVYDSLSDRIFAVDDTSLVRDFGEGLVRSIDLGSVPAPIVAVPGGTGNSGTFLAVDPARRLLLEVSGVNSYQTERQVWALPLDSPDAWRTLHPPVAPSPVSLGVANALGAHDPVRDRIVLLGGIQCIGLGGQTGYCVDSHGLEIQFEPETPTRLDFVEAVATGAGIRVRFAGEGSSGDVRVDRSFDRGSRWTEVGLAVERTPGLWEYVDGAAAPGVAYRYRGRYDVAGVERTTGESPDVARAAVAATRLALVARAGSIARTWPIEFMATFDPSAGAATLELVDVTGRILARRALDAPGPASLGPAQAPGAGLYFVRVRQGTATAQARVVLL